MTATKLLHEVADIVERQGVGACTYRLAPAQPCNCVVGLIERLARTPEESDRAYTALANAVASPVEIWSEKQAQRDMSTKLRAVARALEATL